MRRAPYVILLVLVVALNIVDAHLTLYALSLGCFRELNPNFNPSAIFECKYATPAIFAVFWFVTYRYAEDRKQKLGRAYKPAVILLKALLYFIVVLYSVIVLNNVIQLGLYYHAVEGGRGECIS